MKQNKGVGCGFGCLGTALLFVILLSLMFSCDGGSDSEKPKEEPVQEVAVNQTITFGDYQASIDNFSIADENLTTHITVTNNSSYGRAIDNIIAVTAVQAGTQLSKSNNNLYNDSNETTLQEYLDPGQTKTIELKYKMVSDDNIFELSLFNDGSLGLSDQGLGADLTVEINPVDNSFTTNIYNEANHG